MKRVLVVIALAFVTSSIAASQTLERQAERAKSEQELIALSREFVRDSFGAIAVEMGGVKMTPRGRMSTATVKDEWEGAVIKDEKVSIDGDKALVTGNVVFDSPSSKGKILANSTGVTIHFAKRKGQWKLARGCFGECGER